MSTKRPTDMAGIWEISTKNGQKRLWCEKCMKILSMGSGGTHDCDPNWRKKTKRSSGARGSGASKRKWRLTPKRMSKIQTYLEMAAKYRSLWSALKKQAASKPKGAIAKIMLQGKWKKPYATMLNSVGMK